MSGPGEPRAILVVDDEERLRRALVRSLGRENRQVLAAASGDEALRILEQRSVALVITDLVMPGMDGMALVRSIRNSAPDTRIIIITAYGSAESREEARALGVSCYLAKPFDLSHLKSKVNELLSVSEAAAAPGCAPEPRRAGAAARSLCLVAGKTLGLVGGLSRRALECIRPDNVMRTAGRVAGALSRPAAGIRGLASAFGKDEAKGQ